MQRPATPELTVLGTDTAVLRIADRRVELSARHSELLVVLAAHPAGLAATDLAAAVSGDPGSAAPGVDEVRDLVRLRFRESIVADGGVDALLAWARTPDGATDALVLSALLAVLPRRSPRRAGLVAAIEALEGC